MTDEQTEALLVLHRELIERILVQWAVEAGLLYETDGDLKMDWLYSEVDVIKSEAPLFVRLARPE